ncbi:MULTISPECIES: hypothetical protein [unclassified Clostridium]|uniref:hypothetical protein n=1 Tax=unclassified Clostridium TaxID=2614128 RepID=UPI0020796C62|nr:MULTISPECIES: hypothetical protein [unclassified Clostridium]
MSICRFNYSFKDFMKILFYKKRCPICVKKIRRKSEKNEYVETDQSLIAEYGRNAYNVTIYYFCKKCNKRIEISELKR